MAWRPTRSQVVSCDRRCRRGSSMGRSLSCPPASTHSMRSPKRCGRTSKPPDCGSRNPGTTCSTQRTHVLDSNGTAVGRNASAGSLGGCTGSAPCGTRGPDTPLDPHMVPARQLRRRCRSDDRSGRRGAPEGAGSPTRASASGPSAHTCVGLHLCHGHGQRIGRSDDPASVARDASKAGLTRMSTACGSSQEFSLTPT